MNYWQWLRITYYYKKKMTLDKGQTKPRHYAPGSVFFVSCDHPYPDPFDNIKCSLKKGHDGNHSCIRYYDRPNKYWKHEETIKNDIR